MPKGKRAIPSPPPTFAVGEWVALGVVCALWLAASFARGSPAAGGVVVVLAVAVFCDSPMKAERAPPPPL